MKSIKKYYTFISENHVYKGSEDIYIYNGALLYYNGKKCVIIYSIKDHPKEKAYRIKFLEDGYVTWCRTHNLNKEEDEGEGKIKWFSGGKLHESRYNYNLYHDAEDWVMESLDPGEYEYYIELKTKHEYIELLKILDKLGYKWSSHTTLNHVDGYNYYHLYNPFCLYLTHDKKARYGSKKYREYISGEDFLKTIDDEVLKSILKSRKELSAKNIEIDPYEEEDWAYENKKYKESKFKIGDYVYLYTGFSLFDSFTGKNKIIDILEDAHGYYWYELEKKGASICWISEDNLFDNENDYIKAKEKEENEERERQEKIRDRLEKTKEFDPYGEEDWLD